jgi:hypothetical protein
METKSMKRNRKVVRTDARRSDRSRDELLGCGTGVRKVTYPDRSCVRLGGCNNRAASRRSLSSADRRGNSRDDDTLRSLPLGTRASKQVAGRRGNYRASELRPGAQRNSWGVAREMTSDQGVTERGGASPQREPQRRQGLGEPC